MPNPSRDFSPFSMSPRVARGIFKTHKVVYAEVSSDLRILQVSRNFEKIFIKTPESFDGKPFLSFFKELVGLENELQAVLEGMSPDYHFGPIHRRGRDGYLHEMNFWVIPMKESRPGDGLLVLIEDTTQTGLLKQDLVEERNKLLLAHAQLARANAELRRLSRLKSLFLAMAAHDLRTPLTVMNGFVNILETNLKQELSEENMEMLSIIAAQVGRMDRLISDILDFDQIERGELSVQLVSCYLNPIVKEVVEMLGDMVNRKGLIVELDLPERNIPIFADPSRVQQILYNLISNAIKYTPDGGTIQLRAFSDVAEGVFLVKDNGLGIDQAEIPHLFEAYYRADSTKDNSINGLGLGLFIVKSLVEAQGGEVSVESEVGKGTTFILRLPRSQEVLFNSYRKENKKLEAQ